jgi:hypothetical protein
MKKRRLWQYLKLLFAALLIVAMGTSSVFATTASSDNYQVTESQFNAGMSLESCSDQYCATASIGDMAIGRSGATAGGSAAFSTLTGDEPLLEVIVEPGESNLGLLTTEQTATKTTIIRIRSYLSDGYVLQITGDPPKYKDHTLSAISTPAESDPGTEQFGINLVSNTTPSVGTNPVQVPSEEFSFGEAEDGYNTPNFFQYISGDVVALSQVESGRTDYTVSMIVNIANTTPAGRFAGDFSAVVVPFY